MQRLSTSYKQILSISLPIMLGSAVQNVVALTDSVFLFYVSETDFAAIGIVSVFYLAVAAIGYGFSKGGQIMIARRMGEGGSSEAGRSFYALLYFAVALAIGMFLFMQYGGEQFFRLFIQSEEILTKSLEYLMPRSYGIFFSYTGVTMIALYMGLARTSFIFVDAIILAVVNFVLNFGLIFGAWGLPEMGIAGAGLASTIAEGVALAAMVVYMLRDKLLAPLRLFKFPLPRPDLNLVGRLLKISSPVVIQSILGIGSWFIFFGLIEHMGQRPLAISNLARIVYLILSIPVWGYSTGINTLVSNFIGMQKRQVVVPIIRKTARITFANTMVIALPVLIWPKVFLYPILGGEDVSIIADAQPVFLLLIPILALFSLGGVYINGLTGTGATSRAMYIQIVSTIVYISYAYLAVEVWHWKLIWVWGGECIYWLLTLSLSFWYLWSKRWWGQSI